MAMIVVGPGLNGAGVTPKVRFHMTIGKGKHATPIMRRIREIEKAVPEHLHPEVRPANAVWIDVNKCKGPGGQLRADVRVPAKDVKGGRKPFVPRAAPADISVQIITAQLWI